MTSTKRLLRDVRACSLCAAHLEHGVRPVLQFDPKARILIAGQAPGRKVHESGVPFDDASGERLRAWLGVDRDTFYDPERIAILPMGFCFPGTGRSGDLPPRPECAPAWRQPLLDRLPELSCTFVIGRYAMAWHLSRLPLRVEGLDLGKPDVTATVRAHRAFAKHRITPLPHPSPRNNIWLRKNGWFEQQVLPLVRRRVRAALR
jgi:uracil-DNA glycosylase